jgi:hypothetical protein
MGDLKAAEMALQSDAKKWYEASRCLGENARKADAIVVPSNWPWWGDLESNYNELKNKVVDLLLAGEKQSDAIADRLMEVRGVFLGTDEDAKRRLDGLWKY